ncbi:hypothetical protein [Shewanella sp. NKUCC06_TVS]|uniref:hypothetical protein n=1 Tax=Shewanella sp. NKUCC06_TVS TaxID=2842128 RepID=UPI0020365A2F|nr:hypothetical protein [Shewanella sp. NKUCC06_TVS]
MPRTLSLAFCPELKRLSPTHTLPLITVPVTTQPAPFTLKARSSVILKLLASSARFDSCSPKSRICAFSAATPLDAKSAVPFADTSKTPLASMPYSASKVSPSATSCAALSLSTKSRLVSTKVKLCKGKSARICKCSRVCGITPSSQAITNRACRA